MTTFIYKSRDLSALGSFVVIKAYRKTEKKEKETHTSLVRAQTHDWGETLASQSRESKKEGGATQDLHRETGAEPTASDHTWGLALRQTV